MAPVIQAISLAMAKVAVAITGSAAVGNFFIAYGFQTLVVASSVAYSSVQQRKMRKALDAMRGSASTIDQGRNIMVRDPIASRRIIYGQCLVSGPLAFMHASGTNNEYLHLIVVLASHEVEEIGDIYFNDELVPLSGNTPSSGVYQNHARVKKFLGTTAGERDTDLESESGGIWTSAHLGKGIARLHVRLKYSADVFPNGIPVIKALVKGKKVYDPRTATTAWSANAALCVGDFLMDTRFGKGIALARIRDTEWEEAANICDEDVTLDDLSTEKRYTCNGTVSADQDPNETLLDLAGAMAGHVCDAGGLWTIRAGAWRTPGITLTDSDLAGPFSVIPRQSRQDTYNGVRGTFISPINQWAPADFPVVKNDTYMAKDGGVRLWKDVAYNFTTSAATAQRLAKIDLEAGRQQIICTGDHMLKAMQCQPGDVIAYTRPNFGWSTKYFEVVSWGLKLVIEGDRAALQVALTVKETAEGIYDWNDGEETTVDLAPNTSLYNPRTVATPTGLTLNSASHTIIQPDGTVIPKLKVSWTAPTDQQILSGGHVEIEYRVNGSSTWLSWADNIDGSLTEDFITDVKAGVGYDVRIRFRNVAGVRGAYATVTNHVVAGDTTAPSAPGSVTATGKLEHIVVDWAANTEADLAGYEVWRNTTNNSGTATKVWEGKGNRFVDSLVAASTTYYYWIKAVDSSGNASGFSSGVNASRGEQTGGSGPTYTLQIQSQWNGTAYVAITVNGASGTHLGSGLYEWTGLPAGDYATIAAPASDGAWTFTGWTGDSIVVDLIENTANNSTSILMAGNLAAVLS